MAQRLFWLFRIFARITVSMPYECLSITSARFIGLSLLHFKARMLAHIKQCHVLSTFSGVRGCPLLQKSFLVFIISPNTMALWLLYLPRRASIPAPVLRARLGPVLGL